MSDDQSLMFGIIGLGNVAGKNVASLQRMPGVQVKTAWSRSPERCEERAKQSGIPDTVKDWRSLIEDPQIDAVLIATPPVLHCEAAVAALESDKHVLCQARMARDLSEAQRMVDAAEKSDRVTSLYPPRPGWRCDRVVQRLLSQDQAIGGIQQIVVFGQNPIFSDPTAPFHWMMDRNVFGVHILAAGMWAEVLFRWIGPATHVAAFGTVHVPERTDSEGRKHQVTVKDAATIIANMANGAQATFIISGTVGATGPERIEFYGDRGQLTYELFADRILLKRKGDNEATEVVVEGKDTRVLEVERDFVSAIRTGSAVTVSFKEGLQYMDFMDAADRSIQFGRITSLSQSL